MQKKFEGFEGFTMVKAIALCLCSVFLLLTGRGCSSSASSISGKVKLLNGPTRATRSTRVWHLSETRLAAGSWYFTPAKMKVTVLGVGFVSQTDFEQSNDEGTFKQVTDCVATYDRSQPSLTLLSNCDVTIPTGTYVGVTIKYSDTPKVLFDGTDQGVYSTSSGLTTTNPGTPSYFDLPPGMMSSGTNKATSYFAEPMTINESSTGGVSVVIDANHLVRTQYSSSTFSNTVSNSLSFIFPSLAAVGKTAYYGNMATNLAYNSNTGSYLSFAIMYDTITHPVSLISITDGADPCHCPTGTDCTTYSYAYDGTQIGTYGYLGLDSMSILSWAFPTTQGSVAGKNGVHIAGLRGVYSMPAKTTIGASTSIDYQCTSSPPVPTSGGHNYSTGAPPFNADGHVSMYLLAGGEAPAS